MKLKLALIGLIASVLCVGIANANTLRVVVVQTSDAAAYAKALQEGQALLKSKGSSGLIRVWQATYAGDSTGSIVVSVEYPNLEALAKDFGLMRNDADLRTWLQGLAKIRKVVSDSIYEELKP
jgi:hypothetical protein